MTELNQILSEVTTLLPQLEGFINQFHSTVNETGISVVTDTSGGMSIYAPYSMSDEVANNVSNRITIIDRLINTRGGEIKKLLEDGMSLEDRIKLDNPNFQSPLKDRIREFVRLNQSYNH